MNEEHNPAGQILTYEDAAELAERSVATIYRWVKGGHVRSFIHARGFKGVSEVDVKLMKSKHWTRRPRLRYVDLT